MTQVLQLFGNCLATVWKYETLRILRRLSLIVVVYAMAHIYVALTFFSATGSPLVWIFFGSSFVLSLLMPVLQYQGENWSKALPLFRPLFIVTRVFSLLCIGAFSVIFAFSAIRDILLFLGRFFLSEISYDFASQVSLKIEIGSVCLVLLVGIYQALRGPRIQHVRVPLPGLPQAFEGFRIVQISDLHIGPTIRTSYVQNVVRTVNEFEADMIALTGDITDGSPADLHTIASELNSLKSNFGRYFVTGNHEYYWNALEWMEFHRQGGTHVLMNECRFIQKDGAEIAILGVPDVHGHQFFSDHVSNPELAAKGIAPETIKILLTHQPSSYKAANLAGVHLQLSGHTHAGQFFPWNLLIGLFHDYYRGLNRFQNMWIYVNSGTGYWGPPLRAAVSSEITVLTLTTA